MRFLFTGTTQRCRNIAMRTEQKTKTDNSLKSLAGCITQKENRKEEHMRRYEHEGKVFFQPEEGKLIKITYTIQCVRTIDDVEEYEILKEMGEAR